MLGSMTGPGGGRLLASYRMPSLYLVPIFIVLPVLAIGGVMMIVSAVQDQEAPPLVFTLLWIAAVSWIAYGLLFRLSHRIDLYEDALYWRAPMRHGRLDLHRLVAVRPGRLDWGRAVFESTDDRTVVTRVERGFAPFAAAVQAAAPHARVSVGRYARIVERLPGFSRFRSGDQK
jgi:hypothetical protein